jgi:ketosteroid isomerase-like protein
LDAILGCLSSLRELSGGTFRTELLELLVGDQRVAALQRATGTRGEKRLEHFACQVMTIRDGRIAEVRGYYSDQHAVDDFLS